MANEPGIKVELDSNPGVYGALSDLDAAAYMMDTANDTKPVPFITRSELHEATDDAELVALTDAEAKHYDRLLTLEQIGIGPGSKGRGVIARLFDAASTTRAAVVALATVPASRAETQRLGNVRAGNVQMARAL